MTDLYHNLAALDSCNLSTRTGTLVALRTEVLVSLIGILDSLLIQFEDLENGTHRAVSLPDLWIKFYEEIKPDYLPVHWHLLLGDSMKRKR